MIVFFARQVNSLKAGIRARATGAFAATVTAAAMLYGEGAQAADRYSRAHQDCVVHAASDWRAPRQVGPLASAWPLRRSDKPGWGESRAFVAQGDSGLELAVRYPKGSINPGNPAAPEGGLGFQDKLPVGHGLAGCLSYEVWFEPDFQFAKGGKLPGLWGGRNVSGCTHYTDRGFSTRFMWSREGLGFVYAYFADRQAKCGEAVGLRSPLGDMLIEPGRWHRLSQEVRLNTPGRADGLLRVWFDGALVVDRDDVQFRDRADVRIEGLMFSTFFGGSSRGNASPRRQMTKFRDFSYRRLDPPMQALLRAE